MRRDFVFEDRPEDIESSELRVVGEVPAGLRGRFLAIGPGGTRIGSESLHLLDAYGRVLAASISDTSITLSGRHVETPLLALERAQGKLSQRRLFVNKPARWSNLLDLKLGNNCMHNVYAFGRHLVAAQDPGHFLIDPSSLELVAPLDFGGLWKKGIQVTPMPRVDPTAQRLVAWLKKPGLKDKLTFVELDAELHVARSFQTTLPGSGLMHDVAFSSRHYVVARFAELNLGKLLWGARPAFDALDFKPGQTSQLYIVPRQGGTPRLVQLPDRSHFHFFNAFEDGDTLYVDAVGYAGKVTFSSLMPDAAREALGMPLVPTPAPVVVRYRISLKTLAYEAELIQGVCTEAPAIDPRRRGLPYRYGYAASTPGSEARDPGAYFWFGSVAKLDFAAKTSQVWSAGDGSVCSAPSFVPDPARDSEEGGWLVFWVQDPAKQESRLVAFDAARFPEGPLFSATYPGLFGLLSHVDFAPSAPTPS